MTVDPKPADVIGYCLFDEPDWFCENPEHQKSPPIVEVRWCEHIQELTESGSDAIMYGLGTKLSVPVFPSNDMFALVKIDTEPVVAQSALMKMEHQPDIGNLKTIELGIWNPGEGMRSIRTVIVDYIKSKLDPHENMTEGPFKTRCPNGAHSVRSSRIMDENCNKPGWKWACLWNIVMERACTPCLDEYSEGSDKNFGVDETILPGKPGS